MVKKIKQQPKIVKINELTDLVRALQQNGKKVVLCHGCFDFLHLGHLRHFKEARAQGDALVVTLTQDRYVNKGPNRPFYTAAHRAEMLEALDIISFVCINPWPTAAETIETLKPDIFVKGKEYSTGTAQQDARFQREILALKKAGGKMYFTDDVVLSSSSMINDLTTDQYTQRGA